MAKAKKAPVVNNEQAQTYNSSTPVTFASIWAIKSSVPLKEGEVVSVLLRSGQTKPVKIRSLAYIQTTQHGDEVYLYIPVADRS